MNVQTTWHILYIDDTSNIAQWKYFGQWGGEDAQAAIKKSKIENAQAFTRLSVFHITDTHLFKRASVEELPWPVDAS